LYFGADDSPSVREWNVCLEYIEKGKLSPETEKRSTAAVTETAIAVKTMAATALAAEIKRVSLDPASFEIVEVGVTDKNICLTLRGKNAFGALAVQQVLVTSSGTDDAPSPARWKSACGSAQDVTRTVAANL